MMSVSAVQSVRRLCVAFMATLAVAFALVCVSVDAAYAETEEAGWTVTFTAEGKMVSDYAQQKPNVDKALGNLLPGDSFVLTIQLKNENKARTSWYMSSNAVTTLEDGSKASNGAYTYSLQYNDKEIYSSNTVGGDNAQGFMEISNATGSWFWLGNIDSGKDGQVKIQMTLDGETQNNSYMDTVGKLAVSFAVEFNDGSGRQVVVDQGDADPDPTPKPQANAGKMPQTGDTLGTAVLMLGSLAIVAGAAALIIRSRKKASDVGSDR